MDNANDGDDEGVEEIYDSTDVKKEELLTYTNKRANATALHLAAAEGHLNCVKFLLETFHYWQLCLGQKESFKKKKIYKSVE